MFHAVQKAGILLAVMEQTSYYYLTFCYNKWLNLYPRSVTIHYRSGFKITRYVP